MREVVSAKDMGDMGWSGEGMRDVTMLILLNTDFMASSGQNVLSSLQNVCVSIRRFIYKYRT